VHKLSFVCAGLFGWLLPLSAMAIVSIWFGEYGIRSRIKSRIKHIQANQKLQNTKVHLFKVRIRMTACGVMFNGLHIYSYW
jgi:hypothetical protein